MLAVRSSQERAEVVVQPGERNPDLQRLRQHGGLSGCDDLAPLDRGERAASSGVTAGPWTRICSVPRVGVTAGSWPPKIRNRLTLLRSVTLSRLGSIFSMIRIEPGQEAQCTGAAVTVDGRVHDGARRALATGLQ